MTKFSLGSDAAARIVPFAIYMAFIVVADLLARAGLDPQQLRWLYPVKIIAVLAALWCYRRRYSELAWRWPGAAATLMAVATGVVVWYLWISLHSDWMVIGTSAGFVPLNDGVLDWPLVAWRLAGGALVVPVMEELFWRSFLMRWLASSDFLAVHPSKVIVAHFVVTVILFGLEHNLWFAGVVAGAAYGALYLRTGNLWLAILAHAVTNGVLGGWILATGNWTYW